MSVSANTSERVIANTAAKTNHAIQAKTRRNIEYYAQHTHEIPQRLKELGEEWDIERALKTNASAAILAGSALGYIGDRRFFAVPIIVGTFLLQHAVQGWCPPLPLLRRLGFRTTLEIQEERAALENLLTRH